MATVRVQGFCDPQFAAVRELFDAQFADGTNYGASVCVVRDGEVVVDLWGGLKQAGGDEPWEEDTVVNVFSVCKAWTAICVHLLADRGHMSYDDPISKHWPEFGACGKQNITVRQALCHSAGMQALREPVFALSQVTDWAYMTGLIAAQAPLFGAGSSQGTAYHAFTYGHILGELVRRVDPARRTVGTFFRQEVLKPLGLERECFLGGAPGAQCASVFCADKVEGYRFQAAPGAGQDRVPEVQAFEAHIREQIEHGCSVSAGAGADSGAVRAAKRALQKATALNPQRHCAHANTDRWRASEMPASGGHANARSMATLFAALAAAVDEDGGGLQACGLSAQTLRHATQDTWSTGVLGRDSLWGGGFSLQPLGQAITPRGFGHGGLGGHIAFGDPLRSLGFGFTMNRCVTPGLDGARAPGRELALKVYEAVAAVDGDVELTEAVREAGCRMEDIAGTVGAATPLVPTIASEKNGQTSSGKVSKI